MSLVGQYEELSFSCDSARGHYAIAVALFEVAAALQRLGNGNAATHFGAIEAMSMKISEAIDGLAYANTRED